MPGIFRFIFYYFAVEIIYDLEIRFGVGPTPSPLSGKLWEKTFSIDLTCVDGWSDVMIERCVFVG